MYILVELVSGKDSDLTKLEMEYEVQKQITKAKQKLAQDESLPKNVRKKHTAGYAEARTKVLHAMSCQLSILEILVISVLE